METTAPEWILLRCDACGEKLKFPRGAAVAYLVCPSCESSLVVPPGVLDPSERFSVFCAYEAEVPTRPTAAPKPATLDAGGPAPRGRGSAAEGGGSTAGKLSGFDPRDSRLQPLAESGKSAEFPSPLKRTDHAGLAPAEADEDPVRVRVSPGSSRHDLVGWDADAALRGARGPRRKSSVWVPVTMVFLGVMLVVLVVNAVLRETPGGDGDGGRDPSSGPGASDDGLVETGAIDGHYADAVSAVERFFAAETPEDLEPVIRDPGRVLPLAIEYYRSHDLHPVKLREVAARERTLSSGSFLVVPVELENFSRRIAAVENTDDGARIDWESYVGYCEIDWPDLMVDRPATPTLVRARIAPADYYNYGFADETRYLCLSLNDRKGDLQVYGYCERGTPLAASFRALADSSDGADGSDGSDGSDGGGGGEFATLKIRYPDPAPSSKQVEIVELVTVGWVLGHRLAPAPPTPDAPPGAPAAVGPLAVPGLATPPDAPEGAADPLSPSVGVPRLLEP